MHNIFKAIGLVLIALSINAFAQSRATEQRRAENRQQEIQMQRKLLGPDADLSGLEKSPRFQKARDGQEGVRDEWIIHMMWDVEMEKIDEQIARIIKTYGGEQFGSVTKIKGAVMFFLRTDEKRAEQISEDENVRRVEQNTVLHGKPQNFTPKPIGPVKEKPDSPFSTALIPDG